MSRAARLALVAALALFTAAPLAAGQNATHPDADVPDEPEAEPGGSPAGAGQAHDEPDAPSDDKAHADDALAENASSDSPPAMAAPNNLGAGDASDELPDRPATTVLPAQPPGPRPQHESPVDAPSAVDAPPTTPGAKSSPSSGISLGSALEAGPEEVAAGTGLALGACFAAVAVGRAVGQRRWRQASGEVDGGEGVRFEVVGARSPSPTREADPIEHPGARGAEMLGRRAAREGRLPLAEAWFEAAIRLDPTSAFAHEALGRVLHESGHPEAACEVLERAVRLEPSGPHARIAYAGALAQAGELGRAVGVLEPLAGHDEVVDELLREDERLAPLRDDPRFQARFGL